MFRLRRRKRRDAAEISGHIRLDPHRSAPVGRGDLIVPVYLNQRVVFDLVATLRGGLASVTQVSQSTAESSSGGKNASAVFGLSQALSSLVRVDLSGRAESQKSVDSGSTRSEQRIHTPASLFMTLRAQLRECQFIVADSTDASYEPGDIVEFSAVLRRNPLIETIDSLVGIVDMTQAFSDRSAKGKTKPDDLSQMKKQMQLFTQALAGSDTVDLVTDPLRSSYRAIVTVEQQYLSDPTMSDLVDGTFRVVGKVVRVIGASDEAVSLNRKSAMGKLPRSILEQLKANLAEIEEFSLPELEWEVVGPAVHVLPIAIFA
ncbi:MAG: hypothetical protein JXA57_11260 [Armatimonadetes bacterium]|nr:hypothetical protein [Armatimonadota bacterium]